MDHLQWPTMAHWAFCKVGGRGGGNPKLIPGSAMLSACAAILDFNFYHNTIQCSSGRPTRQIPDMCWSGKMGFTKRSRATNDKI